MPNRVTPLWPELNYSAWKDTRDTLHLWTQVIGKIRLMQTPWLNHSWHVPLYVTSKGLTTSPIPHGSRSFDIQFDFLEHVLAITVSDGKTRRLPLKPQSVAEFYGAVMTALADLGVPVAINDNPCEIVAATPFSRDRRHDAYDADYAQRFWQILLQTDRVLKKFRTAFRSLFSRSQQRRILARRQRHRLPGLLLLRLPSAAPLQRVHRATRRRGLQPNLGRISTPL